MRIFIQTISGERRIIDKRQKTGTQFRVKLLPMAETIYDRYKDMHLPGDKVFPIKRYYWTMNMSLRQVAKYCRSVVQPDDVHEKTSFATTVILMQGVPLETVLKMLGHKQITTTQIYVRFTNDKVGTDMAALSKRLNSVFKVAQ